ncbi:ComF family protein [Natronincola ferrireducens]|uniref:ComF family protein n=1 Tax=Natronincola ferrireducens TaxID=393762 RepID=A0A1G8XKK1_9FIRM|nr:ComF family protein [Natronincola ferrireducens]SDJ90963.1 comF family protein [Natronincola ferrireducens]
MKLLAQLMDYTEALLDFIYPTHINCITCNGYLGGEGKYGLCSPCLKKITFITDNSCRKCSKPLSTMEDLDICGDCRDTQYAFDRVIAVVEYEGIIQKLVFRLKYQDATYLARHMALMMTDVLKKEEIAADVILAVPLYPQKEKQRGYNQAHLLAKYISKNMGIDYKKHQLVRIKNTEVMHNLSRRQRRQNVSKAFHIRDGNFLVDKTILLVDDIFTSGATAEACSKVVIEAGARSVVVVTFARGI